MLVCVSPVRAQSSLDPIDLLTEADLRIDGARAGDVTGSVGRAGDVNGDGRPDVVIGASGADNRGRTDAGAAYVVFGGPLPATIDLATLSSRGFRIDGALAGDRAGVFVDGAGDVNGDGLANVVVGALQADWRGRVDSGAAYVVFGKATSDAVDLAALGNRGYEIGGANSGDFTGSVAGAGDVNGDGRPDVVVGARFAPPGGAGFVVFGKTSQGAIDLAALGSQGFRINGALPGDRVAIVVAGVGDLSGDGLADVVLGARFTSPNGRHESGSAYIVFGKSSAATVNLAALGAGRFQIQGAVSGDQTGSNVAGPGDVNGDGRPDVLVGAANASPATIRAAAYVVFGRPSPQPVDLAALGQGGFRIDGVEGDQLGDRAARAGDLNGDGRADVLLGAVFADNNGRDESGSVYALFGKATTGTIDLAALGSQGFRIDGAARLDLAGETVGAGDFAGDGSVDILVGARLADNNGRDTSGSVYVVSAPDTQRPTCAIGRVGSRTNVIFEDNQSGLAAIDILVTTNATATVQSFPPGTNDPVTVVLTRVNPAQPGSVRLRARDENGNVGYCAASGSVAI